MKVAGWIDSKGAKQLLFYVFFVLDTETVQVNRFVDTWELARLQRELRGEAALAGFDRLLEGLPEQPERKVSWSLAGETDKLGRRFMSLRADAVVTLECQRCLQPFDLQLTAESRLELLESESEIEDEDTEEDPDAPDRVAGSSHFDVLELVEDELILALPYVPKHEVCPSLPDALKSAEGGDTDRPSPFSVLAKLKKD